MRKQQKVIMVVDDDRELLEELDGVLSAGGYRVESFNDGCSALREAGKVRPDVMLLDIRLPDLDGFRLARKLRSRPELAGVPIIAMTGHFAGEEHVSLMRECGIAERLIKPFDPADLISALERVSCGNGMHP